MLFISHSYQKYAWGWMTLTHNFVTYRISCHQLNLYQIVIESSRFDFRFFPGLYRGLPISCQQLKLIWDRSNGAPLFLLIFGRKSRKVRAHFPGNRLQSLKSDLSQRLAWAFPLRPLISLDYFDGLCTGKSRLKIAQSGAYDHAA